MVQNNVPVCIEFNLPIISDQSLGCFLFVKINAINIKITRYAFFTGARDTELHPLFFF